MFGAIASLIAIVVGSIALGDKIITTEGEGKEIRRSIDSTFTLHKFEHRLERIEDKQLLDSVLREVKDIKRILKKISDEN